MNLEGELHGKLRDLDERMKGVGPLRLFRRARRRLLLACIVTYPGRTGDQEGWAADAEREFRGGYSNPLLVYILSWLAVEAIKLIIAWLAERRSHAVLLSGWRQNATQG